MGLPVQEVDYRMSLIHLGGRFGDKLRLFLIRDSLLERLHRAIFEQPKLARFVTKPEPETLEDVNRPPFNLYLWHAVLSMALQYDKSHRNNKQVFFVKIYVPGAWAKVDAPQPPSGPPPGHSANPDIAATVLSAAAVGAPSGIPIRGDGGSG